jgi:hypothetical protein
MGKVVYNACYGGFSLSEAARCRGQEISGNPKWGDHPFYDDIKRHDPVLVQVVEELGEAANGPCAILDVVDLPSGTKYRIDEYDGLEGVERQEDVEWETVP